MKRLVCVDARLIAASGIGTFLKSALTALAEEANCELILLCKENEIERLKKFSSRLVVMQSAIYTCKEQIEYFTKIPRCDLFWAPHFNIPLLPVRAQKRLTTICDVYHLVNFQALSLSQKIYAKLLYNAAFFLSDTIMTISEFSKNEILKYATWRPKKIEIVSPSLDFNSLEGVATRDFILCVGNLKPHKNLVRLVKAYAQLQPKEPLYIVGRKEGLVTLDNQLFQEVEKNPFLQHNVHFMGYVSEEKLKELYKRAVLLIFPSLYEGFGYPPLEAMACGCPVVASQVSAIPEVCGAAVEYIDPYSIHSIAEGMQRLLNDQERREELIQKGREHVEKKSRQTNRIVEVIHACCR